MRRDVLMIGLMVCLSPLLSEAVKRWRKDTVEVNSPAVRGDAGGVGDPGRVII